MKTGRTSTDQETRKVLDLVEFEQQARSAVRTFWSSRTAARRQQAKSGKPDQGERAGVTAGKNMDGFIRLFVDLVHANGLNDSDVHLHRSVVKLPGYFRPTKFWDVLVVHHARLIAALEFKSHVGPSFGNNFNNRAEEAIGSAHDFWTAYREGAFGEQPRPFLGWIILVEDTEASRKPVRATSSHFPVFEEFEGASCADRYAISATGSYKNSFIQLQVCLCHPVRVCMTVDLRN